MKLQNLIILILLGITFNSCKNDLEINAPYEDTAVVYGFLDQNQPIQYIRIQKLYQNDANSSTSAGAKIADSLYFDSLVVTLSEGNKTYQCYKIDTVFKDSGFFGNQKHYLYVCSIPKNNEIDERYQLLIYHPKSGRTFRSSTSIVKDAVIEARTIAIRPNINNHAFPFRYTSGKNSFLYDLVIRFNYLEMDKNDTNSSQLKHYDYYVKRSSVYFERETVLSETFVNTLKASIPTNNSKIRRVVGIQFIAYGGSKEYKELSDLSKPNTSIVQKNTEYTNIENGLGIFTSRNYTIQTKMTLDNESRNILADNLPNFVR